MDATTASQAVPDHRPTLDELVDAHGDALLRYCHHILCHYQDAQDAVQTTFLKACTGIPAHIPPQPWLYRVAYNNCIDILRRRRRAQWFAPALVQDKDFMSEEVQQALLSLSAEERALVFGRVIEERSYEELSAIYKKPAATLRKRYERARQKLLRILTKEGFHL